MYNISSSISLFIDDHFRLILKMNNPFISFAKCEDVMYDYKQSENSTKTLNDCFYIHFSPLIIHYLNSI